MVGKSEVDCFEGDEDHDLNPNPVKDCSETLAAVLFEDVIPPSGGPSSKVAPIQKPVEAEHQIAAVHLIGFPFLKIENLLTADQKTSFKNAVEIERLETKFAALLRGAQAKENKDDADRAILAQGLIVDLLNWKKSHIGAGVATTPDLQAVRSMVQKSGKQHDEAMKSLCQSPTALKLAVMLDATEQNGGYGSVSKCAWVDAANAFNKRALESNYAAIELGLPSRTGGPVPVLPDQAEDPTNLSGSGAAHKSAFIAMMTMNNGKGVESAIKQLRELENKSAKSSDRQPGERVFSTGLLLTEDMPSPDENLRFQNTKNWLEGVEPEIAEKRNRVHADIVFKHLCTEFQINAKGWAPPQNPSEVSGYIVRATETMNLMKEAANYAEIIKGIEQVGKEPGFLGNKNDFKTNLLDRFPGREIWDPTEKKFTELALELPEDLSLKDWNDQTKLQTLRDWVKDCHRELDPVIAQIQRGAQKYGVFQEKGFVRRNDAGNVTEICLENGDRIAIHSKDGWMMRGLDGAFYLPKGDKDERRLKEDIEKELPAPNKNPPAEKDKFSYIRYDYDISTKGDGKEITFTSIMKLEQDHFLNKNHWFGNNIHELKSERKYHGDMTVPVALPGEFHLVKGANLESFLIGKVAKLRAGEGIALAVEGGMFVSGVGGFFAKAAQSGIRLGAVASAGRGTIGVVSLMDPVSRQMGESGKTVQDITHKAIMLDITQGLLRGGVKKLFGRASLTEAEIAAEAQVLKTFMGRMERTAHGFMGATNIPFLGMYAPEFVDKLAHPVAVDPTTMIDEASKVWGQKPRERGFTGSNKASESESRSAVIKVYRDLLPADGKAHELLDRVNSVVGTTQSIDAKLRDDLADQLLPSANNLLREKQKHAHCIPLNLLSGAHPSGSWEEKVAASIGVLNLALGKDGRLPKDGNIITRQVPVAPYTAKPIVGMASVTPGRLIGSEQVDQKLVTPGRLIGSEQVDQKLSIEDVIGILQTATTQADRPETRIVAADALYRLGAMGSGQYAALILHCLDKSDKTQVDFRTKLLRQFADLVEFSDLSERFSGLRGNEWLKMRSQNYGVSPEQLMLSLERAATKESDGDFRALMLAVVHSRNYSQESPHKPAPGAEGTDTWQQVSDKYFQSYSDLKGKPGEFNNQFFVELKSDLKADLSAKSKEKLDQAVESRLKAATTLTKVQELATEKEQFTQLVHSSMMQCLDASGKRSIFKQKADERLHLSKLIRVIDAIGQDKNMTATERTAVAETALGILRIPCPDTIQAAREPYMAKMAVLARSKSIFSGTKQSNGLEDELQTLLQTNSDGDFKGWSEFSELRAAAINTFKAMGSVNPKVIELIADRIKLNLETTDQLRPFKEPIAEVRAAALEALVRLDPGVLRDPEKHSSPKRANEPAAKVAPTAYMDKLRRHETDPAVAQLLFQIREDKGILHFNSADYQKLKQEVDVSINDAKQLKPPSSEEIYQYLVSSNATSLLTKDFNSQVELKADQAYKNPHEGIGNGIQALIRDDKDNTQMDKNAHSDAHEKALQELTGQRDLARKKFTDLYGRNADMTVRILLKVLMGSQEGLFDPVLSNAMTIASDNLLKLCESNVIENKYMLAMAVRHYVNNPPAGFPPEIRFNMLRCISALTVKDGEPKADRPFSKFEACTLIPKMLMTEVGRLQSVDAEKRASANLIKILSDEFYQSEIRAREYILDSMANNADFKEYLPEEAKFAESVLQELRHGVAHIYLAVKPNEIKGTSSGPAAYMLNALNSSEPGFETEACTAIFRACKNNPIVSESDERIAALRHAMQSGKLTDSGATKVRLAAALIAADSSVDHLFAAACQCLGDIAVNSPKECQRRYAMDVLKGIIDRGQPVEQNTAYQSWKRFHEPYLQSRRNGDKSAPLPLLDSPVSTTDGVRQVKADVPKDLVQARSSNGVSSDFDSIIKEFKSKKLSQTDSGSDLPKLTRVVRSPNPLLELKSPPSDPADQPLPPSKFKFNPGRLSISCVEGHHGKTQHLSDESGDFKILLNYRKEVDPFSPEAIQARVANELSMRASDISNDVDKVNWGGARQRAAIVAEQQLAKRNCDVAANILTARLESATSDPDKVHALRACCQTTPISSNSDARVRDVLSLLKPGESRYVMFEAAAIILRHDNGRPFHKGFSDDQRKEALSALVGSRSALLNLSLCHSDGEARSQMQSSVKTLLATSETAAKTQAEVTQYMMHKRPKWEQASIHLPADLAVNPLIDNLPGGRIRVTRQIAQGYVFAERQPDGEISKVVAPEGVRYADVLSKELKSSKLSAEQKLQNCMDMFQKQSEASGEEKLQAFAQLCILAGAKYETAKGFTQIDVAPSTRLAAIKMIFENRAEGATVRQVNAATASLVELAVNNSDGLTLLMSLEDELVPSAIFRLADHVMEIDPRKNPSESGKRLDLVLRCADKWIENPIMESAVYQIYFPARIINSSVPTADEQRLQKIHTLVNRVDENPRLTSINATDSRRKEAMMTAITTEYSGNDEISLSAAIGLLGKQGVALTKQEATAARTRIHSFMVSELGEIRRLENQPNPDKDAIRLNWAKIEKVMDRIGCPPDQLVRVFAKLEGRTFDKQQDQGDLYAKLAKHFDTGSNLSTAEFYRQKAQDLRIGQLDKARVMDDHATDKMRRRVESLVNTIERATSGSQTGQQSEHSDPNNKEYSMDQNTLMKLIDEKVTAVALTDVLTKEVMQDSERLLLAQKKIFGEKSPECAEASAWYGKLLVRCRRPDLAEPHLRSAMTIMEKDLGQANVSSYQSVVQCLIAIHGPSRQKESVELINGAVRKMQSESARIAPEQIASYLDSLSNMMAIPGGGPGMNLSKDLHRTASDLRERQLFMPLTVPCNDPHIHFHPVPMR